MHQVFVTEIDTNGLTTIGLQVSHPDLPETGLGDLLPLLSPVFRMSPKRINDTEFVEWGL